MRERDEEHDNGKSSRSGRLVKLIVKLAVGIC